MQSNVPWPPHEPPLHCGWGWTTSECEAALNTTTCKGTSVAHVLTGMMCGIVWVGDGCGWGGFCVCVCTYISIVLTIVVMSLDPIVIYVCRLSELCVYLCLPQTVWHVCAYSLYVRRGGSSSRTFSSGGSQKSQEPKLALRKSRYDRCALHTRQCFCLIDCVRNSTSGDVIVCHCSSGQCGQVYWMYHKYHSIHMCIHVVCDRHTDMP